MVNLNKRLVGDVVQYILQKNEGTSYLDYSNKLYKL